MINLFILSVIVLISFLLGIFCGMSARKNKYKNAGIFHINTTDPNKDVIQIELSIPIGDLITKKEVMFIVEDETE